MADLTVRRKMERSKVYEVIDSERKFQDRKWGTIEQHPHEVGGWLTLMRTLLSDAEKVWATNNNDGPALDEIRKVLAVGVACCEQHGVEHRWLHTDIEGKGRRGVQY